APALCAITNPTTNSYKRLVPGYEAPVNLAYSRRNRSASIRIPVYSPSPKAKRLEFRCPDGSSNPYLAFSAMLMAMLDGIKNKMKPGEPLDKDIYDLEPEELAKVPKAPGSLDEALNALEKDHEFLLQGDVFTRDVISTWIWYKREKEVDAIRLRPHPYEVYMYFDIGPSIHRARNRRGIQASSKLARRFRTLCPFCTSERRGNYSSSSACKTLSASLRVAAAAAPAAMIQCRRGVAGDSAS